MALHWHDDPPVDELAARRARRDEGDTFAAFMFDTAVALTRASGLRLAPSSEPWCPTPSAA